MELTVLSWFWDFFKTLLGKFIEILFRVILFCLPLGLFMLVIQYRNKVSKISNLTVYTTDESVWQHIFPGFILVSINPEQFKSTMKKKKDDLQAWIKGNQYWLAFLFMTLIVVCMILSKRGI